MSDLSMFYQKNGITVRNMSRDLLCLSEGDNITSIAEYTERFQVSRWTIQTAIRFLLENECMKLERHGPKGTAILDIDREKLWKYSDLEPVLGFVPPPSTYIHDSLYTGLVDAFSKTDLPINLGYMVPASLRMNVLNSGKCHFVITSKLAADLSVERFPDLCVCLALEGTKYADPFRLYARRGMTPEIADGVRVGVYRDAIEQSYLTEVLCEGKQVIRKYGNYHGCRDMLQKGEIDLLVQRGDTDHDMLQGYSYRELTELGLDEDVVLPVLLCKGSEYGVGNLLEKYLNPGDVARVQNEVLAGKRPSSYY